MVDVLFMILLTDTFIWSEIIKMFNFNISNVTNKTISYNSF